jgi:signal transduction histidine kinase
MDDQPSYAQIVGSILSARPTGGEPSTGLRFSIVHKLVKGMNGELTCESSPQKGASFTILLPLGCST